MEKDIKELFQKNFKRLRERKGLTQKEVAEKLIIAPQSVSKWERGECLPSLEFLPALARILSCRVEEFFIEFVRVEDWAPVPATDVLDAIQTIEDYNKAEETERAQMDGKHLTACLLLMKIEMEIFNRMPTDMCYLASVLGGEKEDREYVIAWLVKDGVLAQHNDKYYFKNLKYTAKVSERIAKQY